MMMMMNTSPKSTQDIHTSIKYCSFTVCTYVSYTYIHGECNSSSFNRVAVSVGDGAVRVWDADTTDEDDTKLSPGIVTTYWQNVQGKVLSIAWHPTKENLLAFGTAESRVNKLFYFFIKLMYFSLSLILYQNVPNDWWT